MAMNFRRATDDLLSCISHEELAKALGVSVASVRQARLAESAKAHRNAPEGWPEAVCKLAEKKAVHFAKLAATLKGEQKRTAGRTDI